MHIERRSENEFPRVCIHLHSLTEYNLMWNFKRLMFYLSIQSNGYRCHFHARMPLTWFSFVPYGGFYVCSDGEIYSLSFFFFFYLMHCVVPAMEAGECLELTQGEFPQ